MKTIKSDNPNNSYIFFASAANASTEEVIKKAEEEKIGRSIEGEHPEKLHKND